MIQCSQDQFNGRISTTPWREWLSSQSVMEGPSDSVLAVSFFLSRLLNGGALMGCHVHVAITRSASLAQVRKPLSAPAGDQTADRNRPKLIPGKCAPSTQSESLRSLDSA